MTHTHTYSFSHHFVKMSSDGKGGQDNAGSASSPWLPPLPPPSALERRLEQLENPPASNPVVVYKDSAKVHKLKKGLCTEDQKIADRLEKLTRYGQNGTVTLHSNFL